MNTPEYTNDVEICVVACKRSGHHAVMSWLAEQFSGTPFFLNNCRVSENPFTETRKSLQRSGAHSEADKYRKEEDGCLTRKDVLLYNFEDCDLRHVFSPAEKARREKSLGRSAKRFNVLVLRDHYNLFASRLKRVKLGSNVPRENLKKALQARKLYVHHAREYLGETDCIDENRIVISFTRWFLDEEYRRGISQRVNGTYCDTSMRNVAEKGEGSSFDGIRYADRAGDMEVLDRWKQFTGNVVYNAIVSDRRMRDYTTRVFGKIPYPARSFPYRILSRIAFHAFLALDAGVRKMRRHGVFP